MGRSTVYNAGLGAPEKWEKVCKENKELLAEFLEYCKASDKSPATCYQYEQQLRIVFIYLMENCENKFFVDLKKRDLIKFTLWLVNDLGVSGSRIASIKSVISSLSIYIERVLDEDYPTFRNLSSVITTGNKQPVRTKNILEHDEIVTCLEKLVEMGEYQIACCLSLMYSSGMRISEVPQTLVDDFKEENRRLNDQVIETHVMRTKGKGKLGKQISRFVFMDEFEKYLKLWLDEREKLGITFPELLATKKDGQYAPATQSTIRSWFVKIERIMGRDINPHALRHALVTRKKREGWPDSVLKQLLHWESIDMVAVYNDMSDTEELEGFFNQLTNKE